MNPDYYELRYIEKLSEKADLFSVLDEAESKLTLIDLLESSDKIVVLGNPGIGKSTELRETFFKLWEKRKGTGIVPLLVNISSFRHTTVLEDLIKAPKWTKKSTVVFFFDGLDEIGNIQDFISELTNFMIRHSKLKLKFVISCRTNIYQKYIIDEIPDFKPIYLNNLSYSQIDSILKKKYGLEIPEEQIQEKFGILSTPFNLNLFAEYFLKYGAFPESIEESWELLIDAEIERTQVLLKKRERFSKHKMLAALKKVSVTNELMQQNGITEENLEDLLEDDFDIFKELPFIKPFFDDTYSFNHKNYQEYFAAKYISEFEIGDIINFIKADGINKVKPNLFNTTTFLLNILDGEKFEALKNWLLENDIEVIFFADSNRLLDPMKHNIFAQYFQDMCIEKSFWINHNSKIPTETLADFADFDFLVLNLENTENTPRTKGSALEILSKKKLSEQQRAQVKKLLLQFLREQDQYMTQEVLRTIKSQSFHKEPDYLLEVLDIIKDFEDRSVYYHIISILSDLEDGQRDNELFLSAIKKYYSTHDNVIRGTEFIIASTLLQTENIDLHLSLLELLFDEKFSLRTKSSVQSRFQVRILERIKTLTANPDYKKKLMEIAFSGAYRIMANPLLQKIMAEIEFTPELFLHVLHEEDVSSDILYKISGFLNESSIDAIVQSYRDGSLVFQRPDNINSFRNWVANNDRNLGLYLEKKFKEAGHVFPDHLATDEEIAEKKEKYEKFRAHNFNILFSKTELISEIQKYFEKNGVTSLSYDQFQPLFWNWYDETGFHGIQYTVHTALETAFRVIGRTRIDIEKITHAFENPYFYLSIIKNCMEHSSLQTFQLTEEHTSLMKSLSTELAGKIDFDNVIHLDPENPGKFSTGLDFSFLKLVLFYDQHYNLIQDKDFYLNALNFGDIGDLECNDGNSFIDHIIERVNDIKAVNKILTDNINDGKLSYFTMQSQLTYAVENNLVASFDKIGELISMDRLHFDESEILEKYTSKIAEPLSFLKSCCTDSTSYLYWKAIELIKNSGLDNTFVLNAALEYLKTSETDFIEQALDILFFLGHKDALKHYYDLMIRLISTQPDTSGIMPKSVGNYDDLSEISVYRDLFELIYKFSGFTLHQSRKFLTVLTQNFSKTEEGYQMLKALLLEIKADLNTITDTKELENKSYYISELIEEADNIYLKSKSGRLTFEDAKKAIQK